MDEVIAATQFLPDFHVTGGRRLLGLPLVALTPGWRAPASSIGVPTRGPCARATPAPVAYAIHLGRRDRGAGRHRDRQVTTFDPDAVHQGLTSERTDLAWNRSGLAIVACVAVLLRRIWPLRRTEQIVALACISAGPGPGAWP